MKKILFTLSAFLFTSVASYAFVDNMYMTSEQYLQNTGYSKEISKMIQVNNQDPYRDVYESPKGGKELAKRVYNYLVPAMNTDLDFYNHNGDYNSTNWKDL